MATGNHPAAADRLAAVIALGSEDPNGRLVLQSMLAVPEGRQAMADRLATDGNWRPRFVRYAIDALPAMDIWLTLEATEEAGAPLPCTDLQQVHRRLLRENGDAPPMPARCG